VAPLPFNLGLVQFLADHRNTFLTKLANIAAFAGGVEGYILLAALIYVVWNKRLAIQLSVVMLAALSINDLLKMLVRNPRPFIAQGTYLQKWRCRPKARATWPLSSPLPRATLRERPRSTPIYTARFKTGLCASLP